jgi:hypothetical protein
MMIRVAVVSDFHMGETVVLLAMDGAGAKDFRAALMASESSNTWHVVFDGTTHEFSIEEGDLRIQISPGWVRWKMDREKIAEISEKLAVLIDAGRPSHHYVDMGDPAKTLVLSRDEY